MARTSPSPTASLQIQRFLPAQHPSAFTAGTQREHPAPLEVRDMHQCGWTGCVEILTRHLQAQL